MRNLVKPTHVSLCGLSRGPASAAFRRREAHPHVSAVRKAKRNGVQVAALGAARAADGGAGIRDDSARDAAGSVPATPAAAPSTPGSARKRTLGTAQCMRTPRSEGTGMAQARPAARPAFSAQMTTSARAATDHAMAGTRGTASARAQAALQRRVKTKPLPHSMPLTPATLGTPPRLPTRK